MDELTIRVIRAADFDQYASLSNYAFGVPTEGELKLLTTYANSRHVFVAELEGRIVSQLFIHSLGLWANGVCLPLGGIAGVITTPEDRRRGYAAQLLAAALKDMQENLGYCVSMLYPAVYSLYRRYGWAIADTKRTYTAPPAAFQLASHLAPTTAGRIIRKQAEREDIQALQSIRHNYALTHNGYVERDRLGWELRSLDLVYEAKPRWLALHCNADNVPDGYLLYEFCETAEGERGMLVHELVAPTPAAFYRLVTFLSQHSTLSSISLPLGEDVPLCSLVADPLYLRITIDPHQLAMLRIVSVGDALESRPILDRSVSGAIVLQVIDEIASWNNGCWKISLGSGQVKCEKLEEASDADAIVDISVLAQLFIGYISITTAIQAGLLKVLRPHMLQLAEALFQSQAPPFSGEGF